MTTAKRKPTAAQKDRVFRLPSIVSAVEFRRQAYGWSRTRMATALGIGRSHYNEFINRKRRLPVGAMCKAFEIGVPAGALLQTPATKREYERRQAQELSRDCAAAQRSRRRKGR